MRLDVVEAFVDATLKVMRSTFGSGFGRGDVVLADSLSGCGDLSVQSRVGGDLQGLMVLSLSRASALGFCRHLGICDGEEIPPMGLDYLRELGNVISGNAVSILNDLGYQVTMGLPRVVGAEDLGREGAGTEVCRIPIFSDVGSLTVQVVFTAI
jgi:CheY-specific phosphatase CheX